MTDTYSGYLNIGDGKHLHYLFFASQANPATDVSDYLGSQRERPPPRRRRRTPPTRPSPLAPRSPL
jgi:hypothetical protein